MMWLWFGSGWFTALGLGGCCYVLLLSLRTVLDRELVSLRIASEALDRVEHEKAYAWCRCLGWIATLQRTAELAYWCGVSDGPYNAARQREEGAYIGAEQAYIAAQDTGLLPEDPDPFDFLEGST